MILKVRECLIILFCKIVDDEVIICLVNNVEGIEGWGILELEYNGVKGLVCDDDWDDFDVKVVCIMLGYRYIDV